MNDKHFEKINVEIVISIQQCTLVSNFTQFGELSDNFLGKFSLAIQFPRPNLPKKDFSLEH